MRAAGDRPGVVRDGHPHIGREDLERQELADVDAGERVGCEVVARREVHRHRRDPVRSGGEDLAESDRLAADVRPAAGRVELRAVRVVRVDRAALPGDLCGASQSAEDHHLHRPGRGAHAHPDLGHDSVAGRGERALPGLQVHRLPRTRRRRGERLEGGTRRSVLGRRPGEVGPEGDRACCGARHQQRAGRSSRWPVSRASPSRPDSTLFWALVVRRAPGCAPAPARSSHGRARSRSKISRASESSGSASSARPWPTSHSACSSWTTASSKGRRDRAVGRGGSAANAVDRRLPHRPRALHDGLEKRAITPRARRDVRPRLDACRMICQQLVELPRCSAQRQRQRPLRYQARRATDRRSEGR